MIVNNAIRRTAQVAVAASTLAVLGAGFAAACHPQGVIVKDVQDTTTGSALVKADSASSALNVHPGDTLVYHITVSNKATAQNDQMINTVITDQLPAGLKLVKEDSFQVGTVAQGKSFTRTITVQVINTSAATIKNQACFTGDSIDHKQPQKGCDLAYVKVVVPAPTPTPTPSPSVSPTPTPQVLGDSTQPTLPDTGSALAGTSVGLGAMVASGVAYIRSRKQK